MAEPNPNPNEGWEEFNFYVSRVGDFFDSFNASWGQTATALEKQILNSAITKFNHVTTLLPSMFADYNSLPPGATDAQRWQKVADGFINGVGSSLVVNTVAMGLGSFFGSPFGVVSGITAGVLAGAALDNYVLGDFSPTNLIYNTYESYVTFGEWDGTATTLRPIIISSVPKTVVTIAYENINRTFDQVNSQFNTNVTLDEFIEIKTRGDAAEFYYKLSPYDSLALGRAAAIEQAVNDFIQEYLANKEEIDEQDPEMEAIVEQLSDALTGMAIASNYMSPLVLDLGGDGLSSISLDDSSAMFDFGTEVPLLGHGWVGSADGLLALDKDANGSIDGVHELFGGRSLDGFSQLENFDDNHDGVIDAGDAIFAGLLVWRDANSDGTSEASELKTLGEHGIVSISLATSQQVAFDNGNFVPLVSTFTLATGETRQIADVYFATREIAGEPYQAADPASRVLLGSDADDTLVGSAADQIYFGGAGADRFVFNAGSGSDIIADFQSGIDIIDLTDWNAPDFAALDIRADAEGTIIVFGENQILLHGQPIINPFDISLSQNQLQ